MKKLIAFLLTLATVLALFAGCTAESAATDPTQAQTPSVTDPTPTDPSDPGNDQPTDPSVPENKDTVTIYASVPSEWATPYCWAWNSEGNAFDAWPGAAMTKNGQWYAIEVPNSIENVIISNNGNPQTEDLTVIKGSDAWVVVKTKGNASVYESEPNLSLPTNTELENSLNAQVEALVASLGGAIDTSVFEHKAGAISTENGTGNREYSLKALRGDVAITSAKLDQHEFIGGAEITVSQLMAEGWSCEKLDSVISPSFVGMIVCKTPNGQYGVIHGFNNTAGDIAFRDCVVDGFSAEYHGLNFSADAAASLNINGALITKSMTLPQFVEAVGCPESIYILQCFSDWSYDYSYITLNYGSLSIHFKTTATTTILDRISLL